MDTISMPNILLVAGTGKNVGKTTLVCSIISKFSGTASIIGIKISSHFHKDVQSGKLILQRYNLFIAEELDSSKVKDSSKYLAAGAAKSYFVMAADDQIPEAMSIISSLNKPEDMYVCESGGLRNWITPGVFLMVDRVGMETTKPSTEKLNSLCNRWVVSDGKAFDLDIELLQIINNTWQLKE